MEKSRTTYKSVLEKYPMLGSAIRNALMSKVTNSHLKKQEREIVVKALSKLKGKKRRKKAIDSFLKIRKETSTFADIQPNVVLIIDSINE